MKTRLSIILVLMSVCLAAQQPTTNDTNLRFLAVDIYVDSRDKPLAAYQLELKPVSGNARIVGVEGGEHPAFTEAPFYDSKAIQRERVIIAAFSTQPGSTLPNGKTRVARIHVQISEAVSPEFDLQLQAAADSEGNSVTAVASFERGNTK